MIRIKIWLNWFTAKDADRMSENYSGLRSALMEIAKEAKTGKKECFVKNISRDDISKLEKLGYEVKSASEEWNYGIKTIKHLIKW